MPSSVLAVTWSTRSAVSQAVRERMPRFPPFGPEHLGNSLRHLAELAARA
jgi:hypothetical protein